MAAEEERAKPPDLLSIGELAERAGVARTALRYYDEFGLVRPVVRVSGQRRYPESAIKDVRVICFLREVGFSLSEVGAFLSAGERRLRNADPHPQGRRACRAAAPARRGPYCA